MEQDKLIWWKYIKVENEYRLVSSASSEEAIDFSRNGIAICYDCEDFFIHKHGDPLIIKPFYDYLYSGHIERGSYSIADKVTYFESDDWNLEELNKIIGGKKDLKEFHEKMIKAKELLRIAQDKLMIENKPLEIGND